jgi:dTDP-glucose 4,6-dehydratase
MLIAEIMRAKVQINKDEARLRPQKSEVERLLANNNKAKELLDWEPRAPGLAGLKAGLVETINWFTNHDNLKLYKADLYNL